VIAGTVRVVLYDMRDDSPTRGQVQELVLNGDDANAPFVRVPPMVAHAFQGISDLAVLIDLPSTEAVAGSDFLFNEPGTIPYEFK
jgi:dTDP-4-dehydrorhamnose 3,5-epimerase-like enzyme